MVMIAAIVLSAGSSRRMGAPKALLKIGRESFLERIVRILHSARILDVTIVLGSDAEAIRKEMAWFRGTIAVNPTWEEGQLSSIIAGLDAIETNDLDGVMICPVDHPLLSQAVIVEMLRTFWISGKSIVVPTHDGRRGHPVIFAVELLDELRRASPDAGARSVLRNHPGEIAEVECGEEGILMNIDTPADYEASLLRAAP